MSGTFIMVIKDKGQMFEEVHYCGNDEIQAQRRYKRLEGCQRLMVRAEVKRQMIQNVPFIMSYEVIEVIK
ncbi:TPA: hypothetical protein K8M77_000296 [Clostridium perfringens]|nr:hypothetical protein [Clostridium perfringens]